MCVRACFSTSRSLRISLGVISVTATPARPARPVLPDAMQVLVRGERHVVVDHVRDVVDVEAAGRDIGRDQVLDVRGAELLHGAIALALGEVAVEQADLVPAPAELRLEHVGGSLGLHEDQRHDHVGLIEDLRQRVGLVRPGRLHVELADLRGDLRPGADLHGLRIVHVAQREPAHPLRHRGAEEQRLTLRRALPEDPFDIGRESHVEHAVGLIEDADADVCEGEGAPLDVVAEPAGGRDDDVRSLAQLLHLTSDRVAAVDRDAAQLMALAEPGQLVVHLDCQLSGGTEHERLYGAVTRIEPLDDRNPERRGLAAPGLRLTDDVPPRHRKRQRSGLNGRGHRVSELGNRVLHGDAQGELVEADRFGDECAQGLIDRRRSCRAGPCGERSTKPRARRRTQDDFSLPRIGAFTACGKIALMPCTRASARSSRRMPATRHPPCDHHATSANAAPAAAFVPRVVVIDLDGTTIDYRQQLHPRVRDAVRAVAAHVPVIVATGRMYRSSLPWAVELGVHEPLVCYQGALVREMPQDDGSPGQHDLRAAAPTGTGAHGA